MISPNVIRDEISKPGYLAESAVIVADIRSSAIALPSSTGITGIGVSLNVTGMINECSTVTEAR
jgi:hypothetical protein